MAKPEDKKVLVIDDEEDVVTYLRMILEDAGFNVVTARDGEEALEQVKKHKPDFISLDLVMPKKSGIRFYYELRKNKEWSRIPVVVVSGHHQDPEIKKDMEDTFAGKTISGPQVYLEKPVKPADFVNIVKKTLSIEVEEVEDEKTIRDELKGMLDQADPETLRKILDTLKKK